MFALSDKLIFSNGIHCTDQLYLQRRFSRAERRPVRSMRGGHVQATHRSRRVHELRDGDVLDFYWCYNKHGSVSQLSGKLQLACGESSSDKLHLQHRRIRTERRHVHTVRSWNVQTTHRSRRVHELRDGDVLDSCRGHRNRNVLELSDKLQLACGEPSFDELHLQHRRIRPGRRHLYPMRGGQVEGLDRSGRVHGLSRKLLLCGRGRYGNLDVLQLSTIQFVADRKYHKYSVHV